MKLASLPSRTKIWLKIWPGRPLDWGEIIFSPITNHLFFFLGLFSKESDLGSLHICSKDMNINWDSLSFQSKFNLLRNPIWGHLRHEFQEHGRILAILHEPAHKTGYKAVAFCRHNLQHCMFDILIVVQFVVLDFCAIFGVWVELVQSFLCWGKCSCNI